MSILKFKDMSEVVERANKVAIRAGPRRCGPRTSAKAHAIADSVRAGTVWVIATSVRRRRAVPEATSSPARAASREYGLAKLHRGENRHRETVV